MRILMEEKREGKGAGGKSLDTETRRHRDTENDYPVSPRLRVTPSDLPHTPRITCFSIYSAGVKVPSHQCHSESVHVGINSLITTCYTKITLRRQWHAVCSLFIRLNIEDIGGKGEVRCFKQTRSSKQQHMLCASHFTVGYARGTYGMARLEKGSTLGTCRCSFRRAGSRFVFPNDS